MINNQTIEEEDNKTTIKVSDRNNKEEITSSYSTKPSNQQDEKEEEKPFYIYILAHGLHGFKSDFQYIAKQLTDLYTNNKENALIINSEFNEKKTHQGLEVLGKNLLLEVLKHIYEQEKEVKKEIKLQHRKIFLSVVGHSLGGLILRSMIKLLFFDLLDENSTFCKENRNELETFREYYLQCIEPYLIPTSFLTISSPHLGSRRPGGGFFKNTYRFLAHSFMNVLGKTGSELKFEDSNILEECLLYKMSIPNSDFIKALLKFKYRTLVSAIHFDTTVPFASSSIRSYNPYEIPPYSKPSFSITGYCTRFDKDNYVPLFKKYGKKKKEVMDVVEEFEDEQTGKIEELHTFINWKRTGTEFEPFDGEVNSEDKVFYRDNYFEVEYPIQVLKNLQSIEWRRVDLEFTVESSLQSRAIHVVVVRKKRPLNLGGGVEEFDLVGEQCVDFVCNLLKIDANTLQTEKI
ncbi:hypothetical protein ABK040_005396 [Willaertia magna]